MYLRWGSYQHALAEAGVATSRRSLLTDAGVQYGVEEAWTVQGLLTAASQGLLMAQISAMLDAYSVNFQDARVLLPDLTPTPHYLPGQTVLGGTVVTDGPSFPEYQGGEGGLFRTFSIRILGRYQAPQQSGAPGFVGSLLTWDESLSFVGSGGQEFVVLQPIQGLPVSQVVAERTPTTAFQRGSARGLLTWPSPPVPFWPAWEHVSRRSVVYHTPQRSGGGNAAFLEYLTEWSYEFQAPTPLFGRPGYWR